jgi:hypothetical protein
VRDVAEVESLRWLEMGSNCRAGDSDSDDNDVQPVQVSRKRPKANRYGPSAEKLRAEAEIHAEEVDGTVASLRGAIVAFKAAQTKASTKASTKRA